MHSFHHFGTPRNSPSSTVSMCPRACIALAFISVGFRCARDNRDQFWFQEWWYNSIIKHDHSSMEECQRFCESDIYCGACDFWSVSFPGRISPSVVVSQSVCLSVRVREHLAQFCLANLSYPPRSSSPPSLSLSLSLSLGRREGSKHHSPRVNVI